MSARTDDEILSASPVMVKLGDRSYAIGPQVKKWNRRFCTKADEILALSEGVARILGDAVEKFTAATKGTEDTDGADGAGMVSALLDTDLNKVLAAVQWVLGSLGPNLLDLIYEYSKELEDAREQIEETRTKL